MKYTDIPLTFYLELRCDILEQFDVDVYEKGYSLGQAASHCGETFRGHGRPEEWVWSVILGILARRERARLHEFTRELEKVLYWSIQDETRHIPSAIWDWIRSDLRRLQTVRGVKE